MSRKYETKNNSTALQGNITHSILNIDLCIFIALFHLRAEENACPK
jgi:hypothetical protein